MPIEERTNGVFVSEDFIINKMKNLNEACLKVYLQAKLLCDSGNGSVSCDVLYQNFGDVQLVQNALRTLVKSGLLYVNKEAIVSFGILSAPRSTRYEHKQIEAHVDNDEQLQMLIQAAEVLWGRTLTVTDVKGLYSLYDWLGLPVEVILKILEYCAEIGKKTMAYIEKVAISWHEEGISTIEAAEQKIETELARCTYIYKAKKIFGTGEHNFSTAQKEFLMKWQAMGVSEKLLSFAFDYTIDNTGKLAFPYMDKVLCAWLEAGVRTPEQAKRFIEAYKKDMPVEKKTEAKPTQKGKFSQTNEYDYDEIRRLARKNIRQKLGKE